MNAADLRAATEVYTRLPDGAKLLVKQGLAGRLRSTGLEATLAWLRGKHGGLARPLVEAIEQQAGVSGAALATLEPVAALEALGRASAFVEALHLIERAMRREGV